MIVFPVNMVSKEILISLPTNKSAKIIKWKVKEGTIVYEGRVILLYDVSLNNDDGEHKKLKATQVGTVRKLLVKEGDVVLPGGPLLELESGCSHPTVMNDLCAECGADLQKEYTIFGQGHASIPMVHSVPDLKVSEEQARILGKADEERLIQDRKLVLLVDLDQTLIHTTNDNIPNNLKDVYHFQLHGPGSPWYHTRLRPGAFKFLHEISSCYELHICTFGSRNYAHMIAHYLDTDHKLFSHRILSRDECFNSNSKMANLKALFPCGDKLVCIIDDREDVWNFAPNLIHVKPYHFFQHTGDIHAPPGLTKCENDDKEAFNVSKLAQGILLKPPKVETLREAKESKTQSSESELEEGELKKDERIDSSVKEREERKVKCNDSEVEEQEKHSGNRPSLEETKPAENIVLMEAEESTQTKENGVSGLIEVEECDDYLLYLEEILKNIHKYFYDIYDNKVEGNADLKCVIPAVRQEVLKGTKLVFSGLVPTHTSLELSRAYAIARSLGAEVSQELQSDTTHIVAVRTGTAKVNAARRMKTIQMVTPDWLWMCAERWEHVEERLFPIGCEKTGSRHPPAHCASPEHTPDMTFGVPAQRQRSPSGHFMDSVNPLIVTAMSFSPQDVANMNAEVEDIFNESESDDEDPTSRSFRKRKLQPPELEEDSSSGESLAGEDVWSRKRQRRTDTDDEEEDECEKRRGLEDTVGDRFRRGAGYPSDVELGEDSEASVGSEEPPDEITDSDWNMMGAALEREFLEGE